MILYKTLRKKELNSVTIATSKQISDLSAYFSSTKTSLVVRTLIINFPLTRDRLQSLLGILPKNIKSLTIKNLTKEIDGESLLKIVGTTKIDHDLYVENRSADENYRLKIIIEKNRFQNNLDEILSRSDNQDLPINPDVPAGEEHKKSHIIKRKVTYIPRKPGPVPKYLEVIYTPPISQNTLTVAKQAGLSKTLSKQQFIEQYKKQALEQDDKITLYYYDLILKIFDNFSGLTPEAIEYIDSYGNFLSCGLVANALPFGLSTQFDKKTGQSILCIDPNCKKENKNTLDLGTRNFEQLQGSLSFTAIKKNLDNIQSQDSQIKIQESCLRLP